MVKKIISILKLLRVKQYYKNLLVFIGAFFGQMILDFSLWFVLALGFVSACCTSSINYIVNDIVDIKKDQSHPEKSKKRPLATGELSRGFAFLLLLVLICVVIFSLIFIIPNLYFSLMLLSIIILGQLYNFILKNQAFIDIICLAVGYIIRAVAGCFLIEVFVSPWLFLAIFLVALFLVICKRNADLVLIGEENASKHKKIYDKYSIKLLEELHVLIASSLFITYSLYVIIGPFNLLGENVKLYQYSSVLTIPLVLYLLMRYMYLLRANPQIARSPERAFLDKGIIISGVIIVIILFIAFYFDSLMQILGIT